MIYAVINQKGGVGKSTTASAMADALTLKGFKVLAIDLDPQCNLTYVAAGDKDGITIADVLIENEKITDALQKTQNNYYMIAGSKALAGADALITKTGKEYKLKEALEILKDSFDYVILDTPPALGILTVNALTACDSVIIPAQADIFSLQGIEQLEETMQPVKKYCNANLKIEGILLTRYNSRSILSREIAETAEQLAKSLKTKVFVSKIRDAVVVKEAQLSQKSLFEYAPKAKVSQDYIAFIDELIK